VSSLFEDNLNSWNLLTNNLHKISETQNNVNQVRIIIKFLRSV